MFRHSARRGLLAAAIVLTVLACAAPWLAPQARRALARTLTVAARQLALADAAASWAPVAPAFAAASTWVDTDDEPHLRWMVLDDDDTHGNGMADTNERERVRRALRGMRQPVLWFQLEGGEWLVHDGAVIGRARAIHAPVEDLGREMGQLGRALGEEGRRMGEWGRRMGAIGARMGEDALAAGGRFRATREAVRDARREEMARLRDQMRGMQDRMAPHRARMAPLTERMRVEVRRSQREMRELLQRAIRAGQARRLGEEI